MDLPLPVRLETKIAAMATERMLTPVGVILDLIELALSLEDAGEGDRLYHCETCDALNIVSETWFVCRCGRKNIV